MEFIKGMDVSMLRELEEQGAEYYLGNEKKDIFEIFKETGVNLVRLRLWHTPYTASGEPYGGGTNDMETTVSLAKRVVKNGLQFMLDFHYSDFWTDPSKQIKPKAWVDLTGAKLEQMVYDYTLKTLEELRSNEVIPTIVQIGNEITNGFLWPEGRWSVQGDEVNPVNGQKQESVFEKSASPEGMVRLLEAGIRAVKDFDNNIKVLLHLDYGTDNKLYRKWFSAIEPYNLPYDMIGMSYYPYWNGTLEELLFNMNDVSKTFHKKVLVAETAMGYTTDSLGCKGMIFAEELEKQSGYPASEEGQMEFLKKLASTIRNVDGGNGVGFLYWEPAWLPITACTWAKAAGCEYIHDKGEIGNSWANQALFNKQGKANQTLVNMKNI